MDIFLKYSNKSLTSFKYKFCENLILSDCIENTIYIEKLKHLDYIELITDNKIQLALGDVIKFGNNTNLSENKGLFYLLEFSKDKNSLIIKTDEHCLLPLYYLEQDNCFFISSSFSALLPWMIKKTINHDFYTQLSLLFTQLNGTTYFKEIKRLEYGEEIEINNQFKLKRVKRFFDYFIEKPLSFKESLNDITSKFIEISKYYVQEPCAISLTGGFDGRTITGCAKFHNADFNNFSYGRIGNGDVDNPIFISQKLGLSYKLIELEDNYLNTDYLNSVKEYIKLTGGLNGFQYPQSNYYPRKLNYPIIVTGYLGSEILANAKGSDDELNSEFVIELLSTRNSENNKAYSIFDKLNRLNLIEDEKDIKITLDNLNEYFDNMPEYLSKNQQLSVFSFENTHRNTFGPWIYNAMHYSKLRVPFLDRDFFNSIVKTNVSQYYRNYLETNPLKRIYGQLLYSSILEKVWPELNKINSSKGYAPKDIMSITGRFGISFNRLLNRKSYSEKHGLDKMATISGALKYINNSNHINLEKDKFINLMKENSVNRSYCFLALTKVETDCLLNKL